MALDLVDYELKAREAVKIFWRSRRAAIQKQIESGRVDQGERAGVTAGKDLGQNNLPNCSLKWRKSSASY